MDKELEPSEVGVWAMSINIARVIFIQELGEIQVIDFKVLSSGFPGCTFSYVNQTLGFFS